MNITDKIMFLETDELKAYMIKLEDGKYQYKTEFNDGRVFSSSGTFHKLCRAVRRDGQKVEMGNRSPVMKMLYRYYPWFKKYYYEVTDTLGFYLASLLLELTGNSEKELCNELLEDYELTREKLPKKIIEDINFSEKSVENFDGNKLYFKNAKYEFTYDYHEMYLLYNDSLFIRLCGHCLKADYRGGKRAISYSLQKKLNDEIKALLTINLAGYNKVELFNRFVYFRQITTTGRFDYERYDAVEIFKRSGQIIHKSLCEICDFADLEKYENEFREAAKDDGFFISHIDFYKQQVKDAALKELDILSVEPEHSGLFCRRLNYIIDFMYNGEKHRGSWSPGNANELVILDDIHLNLSESQTRTLARYVFHAHINLKNNNYDE